MRSLSVRNFLLIYSLATAGCTDDPQVGSGGTSDVMDAGPDATLSGDKDASAGNRVCEGNVTNESGQPRRGLNGQLYARRQAVRCYVADQVDGTPQCLPASDPQVVSRVRTTITSCGTAVEFVIADEAVHPLPAACEDVLECCAGKTSIYQQSSCIEPFKSGRPVCTRERIDTLGCAAGEEDAGTAMFLTSEDAGVGANGGAATQSQAPALCCYEACVHFLCI